jgi:Tol biopolymer transport system component
VGRIPPLTHNAGVGRGLILLALVGAAVAPAARADAAPAAAGAIAFSSTRCADGGASSGYAGPDGDTSCRLGIFRMSADGSNLTRLTTGAGAASGDFDPAWSPTGDRIAFARQVAGPGGQFSIFVMNADGSGQRPLFNDPPAEYQNMLLPSWSPTGETLAFEARMSSGQPATAPFGSSIVVADLATGAMRRLSDPTIDARGPFYSPDGRWVEYVGIQTAPDWRSILDWAVWRTSLDGSTTERLTFGDILVTPGGMSFSPDGRYAAVVLATGPSGGGLYTVRSDGTELVKRSNFGGSAPTWSPIGPTIYYEGTASLDPFERHSVIYRVDLSSDEGPVAVTDPVARDQTPSFSLLGGVAPHLPAADVTPPGVLVGPDIGQPAVSRTGRVSAAAARGRLGLLVFDRSGVRRVDAAVGRRARHRCRFVGSNGRLGPSRSCHKAVYRRLRGLREWRKLTAWLPRGTYVLRFRLKDARGNVTRSPRRKVVHLR